MYKSKTWKSVVVWSIISAAFIGPGTVTASVAAGSEFRLSLLWAATFATIACIIVQEVAARITIASGLSLGQALLLRFNGKGGRLLILIIGVSVIAGCAAYEAGNILGAVAGLNLLTGIDSRLLTVLVAAISFVILWMRNPSWLFNLMAFMVALMGVTFAILAFMQDFTLIQIVVPSLIPSIPKGSELLILGIVGTTVVPYNLFLGSGITTGQTVPLMRIGLVISVLMGGFITGAILVAGTAITDFSSFDLLYADFQIKMGNVAAVSLALGLFAAGLCCVITAPFAAAIITRTVFGVKQERYVKAVWIGVLVSGFLIGISGVKPIPIILLVQALNGFILPFLVIFLIIISNDDKIIPRAYGHGLWYNVALLLTLFGIVVMGLNNIDMVLISVSGMNSQGHYVLVAVLSLVVTAATAGWVFYWNVDRRAR